MADKIVRPRAALLFFIAPLISADTLVWTRYEGTECQGSSVATGTITETCSLSEIADGSYVKAQCDFGIGYVSMWFDEQCAGTAPFTWPWYTAGQCQPDLAIGVSYKAECLCPPAVWDAITDGTCTEDDCEVVKDQICPNAECKEWAEAQDATSVKNWCDVDNPCFGRDTHATLATGERVLMSSLKSGDYVVDGDNSVTRVIVNQHAKAAYLSSHLLSIEHEMGSLEITSDHVLAVDGNFVAAREARPGTRLGQSEVHRVTESYGGIINPLTASGKILAQGGVLASTYPEWIADYMLSTYVPLPISISNLLSYLFPATTQAYYDATLERFFQSTSPFLVSLKASLPTPLVALAFVVADLAVSLGFVAFSLASSQALVALAAVAAVLRTHAKYKV